MQTLLKTRSHLLMLTLFPTGADRVCESAVNLTYALNIHVCRRKEKMIRMNASDSVERRLFHGTSASVVDAICRENFDWRMCGKNATAYGQGMRWLYTAYFTYSVEQCLSLCTQSMHIGIQDNTCMYHVHVDHTNISVWCQARTSPCRHRTQTATLTEAWLPAPAPCAVSVLLSISNQ